MSIDWGTAEEKAGFKNYLADGDYTTRCDGVEIKEVGQNGSVIMKFHLESLDNGQFPTADHWLSFNNENFRYVHSKRLMVLFGATEEAAKKAVEMAESKSGKENIIKAYDACFNKLLIKKPEVKVEVYTDEDGFAKAEFKDRSVAMSHSKTPQKENKGDSASDIIDNGEKVDLTDAELPF